MPWNKQSSRITFLFEPLLRRNKVTVIVISLSRTFLFGTEKSRCSPNSCINSRLLPFMFFFFFLHATPYVLPAPSRAPPRKICSASGGNLSVWQIFVRATISRQWSTYLPTRTKNPVICSLHWWRITHITSHCLEHLIQKSKKESNPPTAPSPENESFFLVLNGPAMGCLPS